MKKYKLLIKEKTATDWSIFTQGDDEHINKWILYITKKYPHHSYMTVLI